MKVVSNRKREVGAIERKNTTRGEDQREAI